MKQKVKRVTGTVCFLAILIFMLHEMTRIFYPADTTYATFQTYERQKKNTVEVLYFGTSSAYNAFVNPIAWNEAGIPMFTMATSAQPFHMTKELIQEALKTQSPEVIVVDLHGLRSYTYNFKQSKVRPVIDCLSLISRFRYVNTVLQDAQDYKEEKGSKAKMELDNDDYSYYFPLVKYHTRWKEGLTEENFTGQESVYLGYYSVIGNRKVEKTEVTRDTKKLTDSQKHALMELLEYGKDRDWNLLFVNVPSQLSYEEQAELNEAIRIIEENGYPVVNMNTDEMYEELGIDWNKDFRDRNHVNIYGAEKITAYMVDYLKEQYDLEDCRGKSKYKSWDTAGELFQSEYEKIIRKQTAAPVLNRIEAVGSDTLKVVWNRVYCADGYVVFRQADGKWEKLAVIEDSNRNCYFDTVIPGESQTYTVRAYKKIGEKTIYGDYDKKGITGKTANQK